MQAAGLGSKRKDEFRDNFHYESHASAPRTLHTAGVYLTIPESRLELTCGICTSANKGCSAIVGVDWMGPIIATLPFFTRPHPGPKMSS